MQSQPPERLSDQSWPHLIEAVDPASLFVVIEQRMAPSLRQLCTAEDIWQEALLHAWRARETFEWRGMKSFRSWLLSIIDHRICDEVDRLEAEKRNGGRAPRRFSELAGNDTSSSLAEAGFPAASTTPSMVASYREEAGVRITALEGLPDDLRDVFRLRHFEQLELEEIGRRLGLGVSAVRHRFRKGAELYTQRLRSRLGSRASSEYRGSPTA